MGIVADFVAGAGQYKSKKINILSYILFSLGGTGSYLVFFADPEGWAQTMLGNGTEQGYIDTMQARVHMAHCSGCAAWWRNTWPERPLAH